ncbi:MAG TPA: DUF454 domain-containing protein [Synergistaceae bacterium]|nr:DUF454 domain-containing protein [Synergistaceae bacterium]
MIVWALLGSLFLVLALVGTFLPLVPTVPFVLLAAACFAKSSPKWHRWMRLHPRFGPSLRNWEQHHCISRRMKLWGSVMPLVGGGTSTYLFVPRGWLTWTAMTVFVTASLVVLLLKECPAEKGH